MSSPKTTYEEMEEDGTVWLKHDKRLERYHNVCTLSFGDGIYAIFAPRSWPSGDLLVRQIVRSSRHYGAVANISDPEVTDKVIQLYFHQHHPVHVH